MRHRWLGSEPTAARFRLTVLLVSIVLVVGWALFIRTARWYGQQRVTWDDLPEPVRAVVTAELGEVVLIEIERRPITPEPTWEVRAVRPAGERLRLWLAADGSVWPRERLRPPPPE
jgi:hypothetical protein